MITFSSTFLQAAPIAGYMQLVLLLIIVGAIFIVRAMTKMPKKTELNSSHEGNADIKTNSTYNVDAGFELIRAGKNLVAAIIILICTIIGDYAYLSNYNDKIQRDLSAAGNYFEDLKVLAYINLGIFLIILVLMYLGFYALRVSGEKLAGKRS